MEHGALDNIVMYSLQGRKNTTKGYSWKYESEVMPHVISK